MINVPSAKADSIFGFYKAREELHDAYQISDPKLIRRKIEAYQAAEKKRRESA